MFPVALLIFRETYDPVLQARRKEVSEKVTSVRQGQLNIGNALALAWTRPLKLLFLAPIVPLLGLYSAVTHSIAFICFATVGTVFADEYGFGPGQSGMAYFGLTSGFIFCQISLGHFSDWYIRRVSLKHRGTKPEDRLPPIFIGATLLPIGLFWYGWSLEAHTHWIVPIVGSAFIAMGILYTYLPVQMYLVDSYTTFASSATGAATIIRSLCAAVIPLSANPMFQRLGYGWGNSLLAFIALGGVPVALLLIRFGERIRTNPRFQPSL